MLKVCKCGRMVIDETENQCTFCYRSRKAHLLLWIRKKRIRLNFPVNFQDCNLTGYYFKPLSQATLYNINLKGAKL